MEKKKRIIQSRSDTFVATNVAYSNGKYNTGDTSRNNKAEIGIWNGNLPLVLNQADLCCIPVLIMKGVANCGGHMDRLRSRGFQNWQTSCSMFLSYQYCGWFEGDSEKWLDDNTNQCYLDAEGKTQYGCPEYGVHWKDKNGKVLNIGKYTDRKNGIMTDMGLEPYQIEGVLSGYFSQLEDIDLSKCIIEKDGNVSFRAMGSSGPINNSQPYKIDYNTGAIYTNPDNLVDQAKKIGCPTVVFYQNYQKQRNSFTNMFPNMTVKTIDDWKNDKANIYWGYVTSKETVGMYERAKIGGQWQKWIGNLEKNPDWADEPFLIKVYDPDRGVDNRFSFGQISSAIKKDGNQAQNFIGFFTSQLSDYYNGVTKKDYYDVTFQDYDGSQLGDVQRVEYGHDADPPEARRTGYVFTKWIPDYHSVSCDITCVAQYNVVERQTEEIQDESTESKGTVRIIDDTGDIRTQSTYSYSDSKSHSLRISNNVIGEILASKNENGLKSQLAEIVYTSRNVKVISSYCFHGCSMLQTVDMMSTSVSVLGDGCFEGCSSLTSAYLPDNLHSLGGNVFYGCSKLKDISIPVRDFGSMSQNSLLGSVISGMSFPNMTSSDIIPYCSQNGG